MNRHRLFAACLASFLVIISAPWSQVAFEQIASAWPAQFRAIAIAATAVPVTLAVAVAIIRIRERVAVRYALLALALGVGAAYIVLSGALLSEAFHFVEYGSVAILFYRACLPLGDGAVVVLPLLAGVIVGAADEWFQWFIPIRVGEMRDVLLNLIAVGCGLMLAIAVEPPRRLTLAIALHGRRLAGVAALTAAAAVSLFAATLRAGHEIRDGEVGAFASRFSQEELTAAARDRAARWRSDPPIRVRRLSREDQYLAEGLMHVRARNAAWAAGDVTTAWRENLILERFFEPVLDTPTYASAQGNRWPDEQRAQAASLVRGEIGGTAP